MAGRIQRITVVACTSHCELDMGEFLLRPQTKKVDKTFEQCFLIEKFLYVGM